MLHGYKYSRKKDAWSREPNVNQQSHSIVHNVIMMLGGCWEHVQGDEIRNISLGKYMQTKENIKVFFNAYKKRIMQKSPSLPREADTGCNIASCF